jgi:hypothetical protein
MITQYTPIAQQSIVDQYVPIPFQQLQAMADENKKDYKETEAKQIDMAEKFGNIIAVSAADKAKLASEKKKLEGIAVEGAANSDNLKSSDYRSKYMAGIRSIDYGALNQIQTTTKNLTEFNKSANELAAKGLVNLDWHGKELAKAKNWDTESQGVFQADPMLAYKSDSSIAEEYAKQIKDLGSWSDKVTGNLYTKNITQEDINKFVDSRKLSDDPWIKKSGEVDAEKGRIPQQFKDDKGNIDYEAWSKYKLKTMLLPIAGTTDIQQVNKTAGGGGSGGNGGNGMYRGYSPTATAKNITMSTAKSTWDNDIKNTKAGKSVVYSKNGQFSSNTAPSTAARAYLDNSLKQFCF